MTWRTRFDSLDVVVVAGRWKNLILGLLVVLMMLNVVACLHVRAMTRFVVDGTRTGFPEQLSVAEKVWILFTGVTVPRPKNDRTPAAVKLSYQDWSFQSSDGVGLAAWYIRAPRSKITVLMLHGYAGSRAYLLEEAKVLHEMGHSVVLLDFRGSGESGGDSTTIGVDEPRDVQAAVTEVRRRCTGERVVVLGQSMGAAAALRAVSLGIAVPDGMILEAPFDRMLTTVGNRFIAMRVPAWPFAHLLVYWGGWLIGTDAFSHNPADYARRVTCPALVISGAKDRRVKPQEVTNVYDGLGGWKRIKIFDDVGHLLYLKRHQDEWKSIVAELLTEVGQRPN